ncbi:MAG: AMP-binding protein [Blastocatellia bacterium]
MRGVKEVRLERDEEEIRKGGGEVAGRVAGADNLAYVIHSAGRSVAVEHHALSNLVRSLDECIPLSESHTVICRMPIDSEASLLEIFRPLYHGACITIAEDDTCDSIWRAAKGRQDIVIQLAVEEMPSFCASLEDAPEETRLSIREVICAGHAIRESLVRTLHKYLRASLRLSYGLPETVTRIGYRLAEPDDSKEIIRVQAALHDCAVYVFDEYQQLVPYGVEGEIYVASDHLARGYLRGQRNGERFLTNPFAPRAGGRLFRTGDLGRLRSDGTIEITGNRMREACIRGYRVSLSEIESSLEEHGSVDEASVIVREDANGRRHLVAYVVPGLTEVLKSGGADSRKEYPELASRLRAHLARSHAEYMIPSAFVFLASLPCTPGGEIDIAALETLPFIDSEEVQQCERAAQSLPGVSEVVALIQESPDGIAALHLDDLVPGWKTGLGTGSAQKQMEAAPPVHNAGDVIQRKPAISFGGPLLVSPDAPSTLQETLVRAARRAGPGIIRYLENKSNLIECSYADLLADAERILGGLRETRLRPGDKVVLQLSLNQDILAAFWGCILGGFIPVVIPVPPSYTEWNSGLERLTNTWELLEHPIVLAASGTSGLRDACESNASFKSARIVMIEDLRAHEQDAFYYTSDPDDVAFFVLTSGSTGLPKCIMLSHRNLLARARGTNQLCGCAERDVIFNWLPFDHIGSISDWHLRCVELACSCVYAYSEDVIPHPLYWLDVIDRFRVTASWAPNFAYQLVVNELKQGNARDWDLSCVDFLLTAGESVSASVINAFLDKLAPSGLKKTAIRPAFGMAELGSGVTYFQPTPEHPLRFHTLDRNSLEGAIWRVDPLHPRSLTFTDLGPPIRGVSLRIVDQDGAVLPEETIGRIQIHGDVVFRGYFKLEDSGCRDGWFDTGDLGFLSDGNLVITGREKDTIIINGANYYSHEIESIVEEVEGIAPSFTAACAVRGESAAGDELAVFFHLLPSHAGELINVLKHIRGALARKKGLTPDYLIPVEKREVPKTAIGKLRRSELSRRFNAGDYTEMLKAIDVLTQNERTIPDWFFHRVWRRKEIARLPLRSRPRNALVFADNLGLGKALCAGLRKQGCVCVEVEAGAHGFTRIGPQQYRIQPGNARHYQKLLSLLRDDEFQVEEVIHLWTYVEPAGRELSVEEVEQSQEGGAESMLLLVQALAAEGYEASVQMTVVSNCSQTASSSDQVAWQHAAVPALSRTIWLELPHMKCRHIDLEIDSIDANAERIMRERGSVPVEPEVAYRQGRRMTPCLDKAKMSQKMAGTPALSRGGLYLITGGLGGIGTVLSQWLIRHFDAKLALVGRTQLPERGLWESVKSDQTHVAACVKNYLSIEALGGEVIYEAVDVCDLQGLRSVVEMAESRWGQPLRGVFHLAGHGSLAKHWEDSQKHWVSKESIEDFRTMLRPKLIGAQALARLLADKPDPLFVSFSSVNSLFGGASFGSYAGANSALNGFCHYLRYHSRIRAYNFIWSMWADCGMSEGSPAYAVDMAQRMGYQPMTKQQAMWSLLAALALDPDEWVVGVNVNNRRIQRMTSGLRSSRRLVAYFTSDAEDFAAEQLQAITVRDRFNTPVDCSFVRLVSMPRTPKGEVDKEVLLALTNFEAKKDVAKVAPANELERAILAIWREVLNVERIGVEDNFFDLGGHSLLVSQVLERLNNLAGCQLSILELFHYPTIRLLAKYLNQGAALPAQASRPLEDRKATHRRQRERRARQAPASD